MSRGRRLSALSRMAWATAWAHAGALWFVLASPKIAYADDCLQYARKVSNFVAIPRGLLEDCMRTGIVQSTITGIVGTIAGGAIATAIGKALADAARKNPGVPGPAVPDYTDGHREGPAKDNPFDPSDDERRGKWAKEKLVWDPQLLGWRPPTPGEIPPPENPPEEAPPYQKQNPRADTPPECLDLYDQYVKAQADLIKLEPEMDKLGEDLRKAQELLQFKLTLFTIQFGLDLSDFAQLGVAGVRMAGPLSQAIGKAGGVLELLKTAARKAASLARAVAELTAEVAEFGLKAAKLRSVAEMAAETAKFLGRKADDLTEAALAIDTRVAAKRQLLRTAQDIEVLVEKRAGMAGRLLSAEQRLRSAEAVWQRRLQLQTWAEGERASIAADQARLAMNAQGELDAVNAEIRSLNAKIAQSPELERAAQRTGKATTTVHALEAEIRELETRAKDLTGRIERLNILKERKQAFFAAEAARDAAGAAVDEIDTEIRALQNELKEITDSPEMQALQAKDSATFMEFDEARTNWKQKEVEHGRARAEAGRVTKEIEDALEARNGVPPITPEESARLAAATKANNSTYDAMMIAKTHKEQCEALFDDAARALENKKAEGALYSKEIEKDIKAQEAKKVDKTRELDAAMKECDRSAKALQGYSHPGMDPDAIPQMQTELDGIPSRVEQAKQNLIGANREFDEAYNVEQNVRGQLEAAEREALEARKTTADTKLKRANRGWQEVAAEKDPANFRQWQSEVEGKDPFNDGPREMEPLQREVLELRKEEAAIERDINAKRDQVGNKTPETLLSEIDQDQQALDAARQQASAAKAEAATKEAAAEHAASQSKAASADHAAKQEQLSDLKRQAADADGEVERLKTSAGGFVPRGGPDDPGAAGGDAIDDFIKKSHDLSQQWKPGVATSIENAVKGVAQWAGGKWEHYFNGQSPDEVAEALKKTREKVIRITEELKVMHDRCDEARRAVMSVKPQLDQCITSHTYWKGPSQ